ncbi:hypothetical protein O988_05597 [Pseudogymnoascus sp. VKM F-3808]|nr:hypothetical protein O988_05597 [Pseudogymnoascus sp. VKM F-3808]
MQAPHEEACAPYQRENHKSEVHKKGFTTLFDGEKALFDIIFVHGIGGGPEETWSNKVLEQEIFWPRDFLPSEFPQARILTWGYEYKVSGTPKTLDLELYYPITENLLSDLYSIRTDAPKRPIIWIAHGLGRTIVKGVLDLDRSSNDDQDGVGSICESTKVLFFIGKLNGTLIGPVGLQLRFNWLLLRERVKQQREIYQQLFLEEDTAAEDDCCPDIDQWPERTLPGNYGGMFKLRLSWYPSLPSLETPQSQLIEPEISSIAAFFSDAFSSTLIPNVLRARPRRAPPYYHSGVPAEGIAAGGYRNITTAAGIDSIFASVRPSGGTPTGARLNAILTAKRAPNPLNTEAMDAVKPLNILTITDGVPSDDVESVLLVAAKRLDKLEAAPHQVGVQFFQVGNEEGAKEALGELDDGIQGLVRGGVRDMVDTCTWIGGPAEEGEAPSLTGEEMMKVCLGSVVKRLDRRRSNWEGGR